MLFSFKEIKKLANLPESTKVEEVVNAINSIGFEVEGYEKFAPVSGIKFGRVLEITKNPNADKLNVCRILFDDKERTIQTNADNVKVDTTIIAFVPGSKLGDVEFGAKELKGIISEGMLSAPSEFGINKDLLRNEWNEGISTYEVEDIFLDPIEYLGLNDCMIDVSILSNRSDANSYYVMAKELSAYFQTSFEIPSIKEGQNKSGIHVTDGKAKSLVMFETSNDTKVSVKEQIFLAKHNVKSINDLADITNLTLIYSGQPTHAYDASKVGSDFTTELYSGDIKVFGNKEVTLENDLVIISDGKPISVAGVIGMEDTGVSQETQNAIIELGRFNIKEVRKAVKSVKLNTDASNQSSKEVSLGTTYLALSYLTNKLKNFSMTTNLPILEAKSIEYDEKKVSFLAGCNITKEEKYEQAINSLKILGFEFEGNKVTAPSYRHDVKTQQDMNEEIFRFYGYDNFKIAAPKINTFTIKNTKNIHERVATQGYQEVVTYSLISKESNIVNPFGFDKDISLETFVSKEREVIRNSQAQSLIQVIEYNTKRKMEDISIFDIGMINDGIKTVALASTTKSLKEIKQNITNLLGSVEFERLNNETLHPGVSAKIMKNGEMIGWLGKLHPSIAPFSAFIAEFKFKEGQSKHTFKEYSSDPLKTRDITFELLGKEEISSKISELKTMNIYDIKIIDEFKKDNINKVTIRVTAEDQVISEVDSKFN